MRRRPLGRTLGLSVRMGVALAGIAAIYAFAILVLGGVTVGAFRDGEISAGLGGLMFLSLIPVALFQQLRNAPQLLLRASRARLLRDGEEPELQALVARTAAQAEVWTPRIALAPSSSPNAFAVGHDERHAVLVVTTELLRRLEPEELEAVVAHELAHVANRDPRS